MLDQDYIAPFRRGQDQPNSTFCYAEYRCAVPEPGAVITSMDISRANTKRLYQISKKINKKTYWIECAKNLKNRWFKGVKKTGVMAGASTPDYITKEVVDKLKTF